MHCIIKLKNSEKIFSPGDIVSGLIVAKVSEPYLVKGINVKLLGYIIGTLKESGRSLQTAKEYFLIVKTTICNAPNILTPAIRYYKFQFRLPIDSPPTIKTNTKEIRYKIKATFERPWDEDVFTQSHFKVRGRLLVAQIDPILNCAKYIEKIIKFFNVLDRGNNKVAVKIAIPQTVYQIGDLISIELDVNNMSSTHIYFTFALVQISVFYGIRRMPNNVGYSIQVKEKSEPMAKKTCAKFTHNLRVPQLYSTNNASSIVHICYELVITLLRQRISKVPIIIVGQ